MNVQDQGLLNGSLQNILRLVYYIKHENYFDKLAYTTVSNKKTPLPFTYLIKNIPHQHASKHKYLGATITNNLKWNDHIDNICVCAQRKFGLSKRKLQDATLEVRIMAYQSITQPALAYASTVWDPHQKVWKLS